MYVDVNVFNTAINIIYRIRYIIFSGIPLDYFPDLINEIFDFIDFIEENNLPEC